MLIYTYLVHTFLSLKDEKENDKNLFTTTFVPVHNFYLLRCANFFLENFAEMVVILQNYPQGR